jgi:trypsin
MPAPRSGSTVAPHWPGRLALALLLASSLLPAFATAAHRGVHAQIVGGQPVSQGTYPFMAHLEIDLGAFLILCGGSLIAPHYVLTAAHCVEDSDTGALFRPSQFSVVVGRANLVSAPAANTFGVTAVHQDPDWDRDTRQNDAAVLTLDADVPATIAEPVSFVGSGDQQYDSAGQAAVVAGWGTTREGGDTTDQLLAAPVSLVSGTSCQAAYDDLNPAVDLCAAAPGRDSCQGDSGGPLLAPQAAAAATKRAKAPARRLAAHAVRKGHHHHHPAPPPPVQLPTQVTQIGITSFGVGCARQHFPGVYTRLSNAGVNGFVAGVLAGG